MDKASILGDAIEYVKQLRQRIQDLESRTRQMESPTKTAELQRPGSSRDPNAPRGSGSPQGSGVDDVATGQQRAFSSDKRKIRVLEGTRVVADAPSTSVQVSIIEADALLEMQCPYKEGLLLKIMQTIHELRLEIMSIQSSSVNGTLFAELRTKVYVNCEVVSTIFFRAFRSETRISDANTAIQRIRISAGEGDEWKES